MFKGTKKSLLLIKIRSFKLTCIFPLMKHCVLDRSKMPTFKTAIWSYRCVPKLNLDFRVFSKLMQAMFSQMRP